MGDHDPLMPNRPLVADDLTGVETAPMDAVDAVRVEVLKPGSEADGLNAEGLNLEALRQTIAAAEQRLNGMRELRQQLTELTQERDQLAQELSFTRQQLLEVNALQQQLQALLEQP